MQRSFATDTAPGISRCSSCAATLYCTCSGKDIYTLPPLKYTHKFNTLSESSPLNTKKHILLLEGINRCLSIAKQELWIR